MGEYEEWPLPSGLMLNGLLPNESGSKIRYLDGERWAKAEERTAELIACIQPNQPSENRRGAVAHYVQRLIMRCFPCQVFTFGSVPLKTYLPDGDIDLTAFSKNQIVKDMWAIQVRDILESEERNENAEFRVKEVQYIQAEVKVVKCLVENIVVDISFNQLGGLCTLCFLEEVDNLISQDHLFKRSIILIKAWCYYESRILGAHHGLISTYALETLVLYIFHIFNNSFNGPLEVLFRFLEFFSNFDWENFCVSLWGPVSVGSLPDINVEPPRKDGGELLLRKDFLEACNSVYAVFPGGLENQGHPFVSKHFNVIDPLRINNNLGRSVNKGNFYRIRSAFAFGAEKLAKLLDCPKENIASEVNRFFRNTWERHGSGVRPDAPLSDLECIPRPLNPDQLSDTHSNCSNSKESNDEASLRVIEAQNSCEVDRPETGNSKLSTQSDKSQRALKHEQMLNPLQRKHLFARTRSSPELTNAYCDASSQLSLIRPAETKTTKTVSTQSNVSQNLVDVPIDSTSVSNNYFDNSGGVPFTEDHASIIGAQGMQQEEQDLVNTMASSSLHNFGGHFPMPLNMASPHLPRPISGYAPRGDPGMFPLMNPHWPTTFQFHQGIMSSPSPRYFHRQGDDADYWNELDVASNGVLDPDDETLDDFHGDDDRRPSTSGSSNFVSSSCIPSLRDDYVDSFQHQDNKDNNRVIETFTDERTFGGRSKTSSESSWDGSSVRASKVTREKRGRKNKNGKNVHEYASPVVDDENRDCSTSQTSGPNPPPGFEGAQVSGPGSAMPMVLGSGSLQRGTDNSRTGPFTFYPTGPPVPFFTMFPVYNYLGEADNSEPSSSHLGEEDAPDNNDSSQVIDSSEPPDVLSEEPKRDILNSDFTRHWQNLQFGRFCQGPPVGPPSPVVGPPMYFQGRFPWDGPGRPISANGNLMSQLMSSGHRILPINPLQSDPSRLTAVYQQFADEMPRYRGGTGTYLPNPEAFVKDRHSSRGRRNSHNHDRTDHADRDGNWNTAKSKAAGRTQKPRPENGLDRPRSAYRHQLPTYQAQNGPLRPSSSHGTSYGMYPLPGMNPGEITSNGPTMQNLVMVYPYGHNNSGYVSPGEQLEFGSLGTVGYVGPNDGSQLDSRGPYEDQRYHRSSTHLSSPDQPSSPHFQRWFLFPFSSLCLSEKSVL